MAFMLDENDEKVIRKVVKEEVRHEVEREQIPLGIH